MPNTVRCHEPAMYFYPNSCSFLGIYKKDTMYLFNKCPVKTSNCKGSEDHYNIRGPIKRRSSWHLILCSETVSDFLLVLFHGVPCTHPDWISVHIALISFIWMLRCSQNTDKRVEYLRSCLKEAVTVEDFNYNDTESQAA